MIVWLFNNYVNNDSIDYLKNAMVQNSKRFMAKSNKQTTLSQGTLARHLVGRH